MRIFNKTLKSMLLQNILDIIENEARKEDIDLLDKLQRLIPAKKVKTGVDMYKNYILDQYNCPVCDRPVGDEMTYFNYCPNCGQNLEGQDD